MVGMRESKPEKINNFNMTLYMVYEGRKTEPNYFYRFAQEHNLEDRFNITPVPKDSFDIDNSDRDDLVELMRGYLTKVKQGKYTSFQYATDLMKDVFAQIIYPKKTDGGIDLKNPFNPTLPGGSKKKLFEKLWEKRHACVREARNKRAVDSKKGVVTNFETMEKIVMNNIKELMDLFGLSFEDKNPDRNHPQSKQSHPLDREFVVFDRDEDISRMDSDYEIIFDKCDRLGYDILLSTPNFEFWLLLHNEEFDPREYDNGFNAGEIITYAIEDLEKYDGTHGYYKEIGDERYKTYYKGKFEYALSRSMAPYLATELRNSPGKLGLINELGSNVGIKLNNLLSSDTKIGN